MAKVTFLPVNMTCEAADGESLLDIALNNDVPLQHACGGFCSCTTCHIYVRSGADNLSTQEEEEQERIASVDGLTVDSRLGCQARVLRGEVTVEIQNLE